VADAGHPLSSSAAGLGSSKGPLAAAAAASSSRPGPGEFESFFTTHRDAIHRFLHRLTRNAADADDLLQETFLTAWRKRDQFDGRGSAEGWLRRTAFRLWLNQRTKGKRRTALADGRSLARPESVAPNQREVDDAESRSFLLRRIEAAVDDLPDGPREAFVLFRFEGLTCAQIAEATDAPVKTVETRLRRAAELLSEKVRKYRDELRER
jgi:RNA polymerase sigma-70 factor (ECF subfamily)